jgi:pantoate kinase
MDPNIKAKASRAKRLWDDPVFQEFFQEARQAQANAFLNPAATPEEREEAHAMVRALHKLENQMAQAVLAQNVEQKGQHLGRQD